ncbi:MAG: DUF1232 domain-containing protein [Polyangiaceae bacterium]|nr:DUF1232 domain-containing protein [Polyangiaceae bacterium]MCW5792443.1 DUF1232 domain-containing protein [Polyangiaceae bacterium]
MFDRLFATFRFFMDPRGSLSVKLLFLGALAYLFWPLDLVPDLVPVLGWLDDLGVVGIASAFLLSSIQPYRKGGSPKAPEEPPPLLPKQRQRPTVTEVWSKGYPAKGTWGHFRGPMVQVDGREK